MLANSASCFAESERSCRSSSRVHGRETYDLLPRFLSSDTSVSLKELCKILECLQGLYDPPATDTWQCTSRNQFIVAV